MDQGGKRENLKMSNEDKSLLSVNVMQNEIINCDDSKGLKVENEVSPDQESESTTGNTNIVLCLPVLKTNCVTEDSKEGRKQNYDSHKFERLDEENEGLSAEGPVHKLERFNNTDCRFNFLEEQNGGQQPIDSNHAPNSSSLSFDLQAEEAQAKQHNLLSSKHTSGYEFESNVQISTTSSSLKSIVSHSHIDGNISPTACSEASNISPKRVPSPNNGNVDHMTLSSTSAVPTTSCYVNDRTSQAQSKSSTLQFVDSVNTSDGHVSSWSSLSPDAEQQGTPSVSWSIDTSSIQSLSTNLAFTSQPGRDDSEKEVPLAVGSLSQSNIKIEIPELNSSDMNGLDLDAQGASSAGGTTGHRDAPFKILTKYVYINKPPKPKTGKKKLGLLYKQAFRHFHRSKLTSNIQPPLKKIQSAVRRECSTKLDDQNLRKEPIKRPNREVVKNKREKVGRVSKKKKKTTRAALKKSEGKPSLTVQLKDTTNRRRSPRRAGKATSSSKQKSVKKHPGRKKTKKAKLRKYLLFSEKVDVLNQLENPSACLESIAETFNTDPKTIEKISKEKDNILLKLEAKEERIRRRKEKKRESRKRKTTKVPIKKESLDEDVNEGEVISELNNADESQVSAMDINHSHSHTNSKAARTRNELTLQNKVLMIYDLEKPGAKVRQIAKKFGVSSSAVSRIRKQKDHILSQSLSGDVCQEMKRTRECKDPILDRALLKWYRALEALQSYPISVTNTLLVDKARDIALTMGKTYFPSINWIIRWKYRHNIVARSGRIESKEVLDELDANIEMADIIAAVEGQMISSDLKNENLIKIEKAEKMIICEHCGIMSNRRKDKRRNNHLKTCPLATQIQRRDLTLGEKAQVARALEKPGMKMVTLAKKYGVSSSAISRIHKNRVDILARCAGNYVNVGRKRDRGSKEPEVERLLCEWYHTQQEFGYHVSSTMVREKARDIASNMGKDFWPSDSWVFRWRHRNNVNALSGFEEIEDDEVEEIQNEENKEEDAVEINNREEAEMEAVVEEDESQEKGKKRKRKKKNDVEEGETEEKKSRLLLPRSVMCEKCGCVSARLKNNRIRSMRHAKGCPDLKPRHELTYEERVRMLKALEEPGATLSSVARQFGISASSMSRMNQKRDSIMSFGMDFAGQKRIRDCKEPEVAKMLYSWFMERQKEGIHVTGTKLKEKAASLALEMGREFKASTGWLGRWKHRYNVIFRKDETKTRKEIPKKRPLRKKPTSQSFKQEDIEAEEENHQDSVGSENIRTIIPDQSQPFQAPRMFLNQRYQTPWTINPQPPPSSCTRSKEFMAPPNHGVLEENHVPYAYDHMPRPMFHNINMFENFSSTPNYPVTMVEPNVPVRDYLPQEENEAHQPSSSHHHIIPHQPPLNLQTPGLSHSQPHSAHPQHPAPVQHPSHSPDPPVQEEDNLQQQQIMEACKLMNSFAKEKSLGEHVQAALRTIEMTLKSNERKGSQRTTYTNI